MDSVRIKAYAKINLCLDTVGKRSDGYHLLETVMHTVSLHDVVTVERTHNGKIEITCSEPAIPCNEKNIAYKCADAFFDSTGIKDRGIYINIEKHIPSQAGMGGGSADGAAVLKALNELYDTGLDTAELCGIGVSIGADIPFCIIGGCGYCTGIGEKIISLKPQTGTVLIGKGEQGISTAEAFRKIDTENISLSFNGVLEAFSDVKSLQSIAPLCRNVFELVTDCSEVSEIKNVMLENGALCSCMTGSGSAVFGLYDDIPSAEIARNKLIEMGFFSKLCSLI